MSSQCLTLESIALTQARFPQNANYGLADEERVRNGRLIAL
ncbi:MAG: hypothetical protein ACR5K9_10940 [Wolbachia sp.]